MYGIDWVLFRQIVEWRAGTNLREGFPPSPTHEVSSFFIIKNEKRKKK
jgi:hypothetical protein